MVKMAGDGCRDLLGGWDGSPHLGSDFWNLSQQSHLYSYLATYRILHGQFAKSTKYPP